MVVAEFLFIAFVVGMVARAWLAFLLAVWVHIEGFYRPSARAQPAHVSPPVESPVRAQASHPRVVAGASSAPASSEVIDVEYRVVSP